MIRTKEGKILMATEDWVARLDPGNVVNDEPVPAVLIEQATVDGRVQDLSGPGEPKMRGDQFQFEFTAPSLSVPERIRFRYKLEPLSPTWIYAGSDRHLLYGRIPPGEYRLSVAARDNGGWSATPAVLAFRVPNYFYETWPFRGLCVALVGAAGWGVYWLRLRRMRFALQVVYQERLRVTRELHDTLLQGFAGVSFQIDAALRQFDSAPEKSKRQLGIAAVQAETALREARHAIMFLRVPVLDNSTLREALTEAVRKLVEGTSISTDLEIEDAAGSMPHEVQANLFVIAREAVSNAVNHARPRHISVELGYAEGRFKLTVRDDGSGFDVNQKAEDGHLGMTAMRERAERIRAHITVISTIGKGTSIEISNDANGHGRR
jgi:hypothetical protein